MDEAESNLFQLLMRKFRHDMPAGAETLHQIIDFAFQTHSDETVNILSQLYQSFFRTALDDGYLVETIANIMEVFNLRQVFKILDVYSCIEQLLQFYDCHNPLLNVVYLIYSFIIHIDIPLLDVGSDPMVITMLHSTHSNFVDEFIRFSSKPPQLCDDIYMTSYYTIVSLCIEIRMEISSDSISNLFQCIVKSSFESIDEMKELSCSSKSVEYPGSDVVKKKAQLKFEKANQESKLLNQLLFDRTYNTAIFHVASDQLSNTLLALYGYFIFLLVIGNDNIPAGPLQVLNKIIMSTSASIKFLLKYVPRDVSIHAINQSNMQLTLMNKYLFLSSSSAKPFPYVLNEDTSIMDTLDNLLHLANSYQPMNDRNSTELTQSAILISVVGILYVVASLSPLLFFDQRRFSYQYVTNLVIDICFPLCLSCELKNGDASLDCSTTSAFLIKIFQLLFNNSGSNRFDVIICSTMHSVLASLFSFTNDFNQLKCDTRCNDGDFESSVAIIDLMLFDGLKAYVSVAVALLNSRLEASHQYSVQSLITVNSLTPSVLQARQFENQQVSFNENVRLAMARVSAMLVLTLSNTTALPIHKSNNCLLQYAVDSDILKLILLSLRMKLFEATAIDSFAFNMNSFMQRGAQMTCDKSFLTRNMCSNALSTSIQPFLVTSIQRVQGYLLLHKSHFRLQDHTCRFQVAVLLLLEISTLLHSPINHHLTAAIAYVNNLDYHRNLIVSTVQLILLLENDPAAMGLSKTPSHHPWKYEIIAYDEPLSSTVMISSLVLYMRSLTKVHVISNQHVINGMATGNNDSDEGDEFNLQIEELSRMFQIVKHILNQQLIEQPLTERHSSNEKRKYFWQEEQYFNEITLNDNSNDFTVPPSPDTPGQLDIGVDNICEIMRRMLLKINDGRTSDQPLSNSIGDSDEHSQDCTTKNDLFFILLCCVKPVDAIAFLCYTIFQGKVSAVLKEITFSRTKPQTSDSVSFNRLFNINAVEFGLSLMQCSIDSMFWKKLSTEIKTLFPHAILLCIKGKDASKLLSLPIEHVAVGPNTFTSYLLIKHREHSNPTSPLLVCEGNLHEVWSNKFLTDEEAGNNYCTLVALALSTVSLLLNHIESIFNGKIVDDSGELPSKHFTDHSASVLRRVIVSYISGSSAAIKLRLAIATRERDDLLWLIDYLNQLTKLHRALSILGEHIKGWIVKDAHWNEVAGTLFVIENFLVSKFISLTIKINKYHAGEEGNNNMIEPKCCQQHKCAKYETLFESKLHEPIDRLLSVIAADFDSINEATLTNFNGREHILITNIGILIMVSNNQTDFHTPSHYKFWMPKTFQSSELNCLLVALIRSWLNCWSLSHGAIRVSACSQDRKTTHCSIVVYLSLIELIDQCADFPHDQLIGNNTLETLITYPIGYKLYPTQKLNRKEDLYHSPYQHSPRNVLAREDFERLAIYETFASLLATAVESRKNVLGILTANCYSGYLKSYDENSITNLQEFISGLAAIVLLLSLVRKRSKFNKPLALEYILKILCQDGNINVCFRSIRLICVEVLLVISQLQNTNLRILKLQQDSLKDDFVQQVQLLDVYARLFTEYLTDPELCHALTLPPQTWSSASVTDNFSSTVCEIHDIIRNGIISCVSKSAFESNEIDTNCPSNVLFYVAAAKLLLIFE